MKFQKTHVPVEFYFVLLTVSKKRQLQRNVSESYRILAGKEMEVHVAKYLGLFLRAPSTRTKDIFQETFW